MILWYDEFFVFLWILKIFLELKNCFDEPFQMLISNIWYVSNGYPFLILHAIKINYSKCLVRQETHKKWNCRRIFHKSMIRWLLRHQIIKIYF